MLLQETILRLRATCPLFASRVVGTQAFQAATADTVTIDTPCCFVVPMSDTAEERGNLYSQRVTERFATIICADNSMNPRQGRGYAAETVLRDGRQQIADALMNWAPVTMPNLDDVQYARSQHLHMNNARIWHQYEWTCAYMFGPRGNPQDNPNYLAIERVIKGHFPFLDAVKVKKVMTNLIDREPINPDDDETYATLYEVFLGTNPEWIKETPIVPGTGSTTNFYDVQNAGRHLKVDP